MTFLFILQKMTENIFAIVEFVNCDTVDTAPMKWLSTEEDFTHWPADSDRVSLWVRDQHDCDPSWNLHAVRVLGKAGM